MCYNMPIQVALRGSKVKESPINKPQQQNANAIIRTLADMANFWGFVFLSLVSFLLRAGYD